MRSLPRIPNDVHKNYLNFLNSNWSSLSCLIVSTWRYLDPYAPSVSDVYIVFTKVCSFRVTCSTCSLHPHTFFISVGMVILPSTSLPCSVFCKYGVYNVIRNVWRTLRALKLLIVYSPVSSCALSLGGHKFSLLGYIVLKDPQMILISYGDSTTAM